MFRVNLDIYVYKNENGMENIFQTWQNRHTEDKRLCAKLKMHGNYI